jgi:hypothetical protein
MNSPVNNTSMDVIVDVAPTKVMKSLPVKHKCVMLGMLGLVEHLKLHTVLPDEHLQSTFETFKQMLFMAPDEQVAFLDKFVDIQYLEKTLIKQLIQEHKKELKTAEKEKVKAEKKAEREKNKPVKEPKKPKSPDDDSVQKETAAQKKERLQLEKQKEKEDKAAQKLKEKEDKAAQKLKEKEDKAAQKLKEKEDKKAAKATTVSKKGKSSKKSSDDEPAVIANETLTLQHPQECTDTDSTDDKWTMIVIDGTKYWIDDFEQQNGILMTNVINEDGDSTPGKPIGEMRDGVIHFTVERHAHDTPVLPRPVDPVDEHIDDSLAEVLPEELTDALESIAADGNLMCPSPHTPTDPPPVSPRTPVQTPPPLPPSVVEQPPSKPERPKKLVPSTKNGTKSRILKKVPKLKLPPSDDSSSTESPSETKSKAIAKRGRQAIKVSTVLDKVPEMPSEHSPQSLCNTQQTSTSVDELCELMQETYVQTPSKQTTAKLAVNK